jgi:hypothetical protein
MSKTQLTIKDLQIGSRLLYRSKKDWRTAVISRFSDENATLIVCSPSGRTYRLKRKLKAKVYFQGSLLILKTDNYPKEKWKDNYGVYDKRW